jgi:hypothetical protein
MPILAFKGEAYTNMVKFLNIGNFLILTSTHYTRFCWSAYAFGHQY